MGNRFSPPHPLAKILGLHLKKLNLDKKIKNYSVVDCWQNIVGPSIAQHSAAKRISDGCLYLEVEHPTWFNELKMLEPQLLEKIKAFDPSTPIRKIRFQLK